MVRRFVVAVCILVLALATASCTKLNQSQGPLTWETAKFNDAIPQNYGSLIGLTQNQQTPAWVGLWFQRSDGTITAVFVNPQEGKISEKTLTIPRK